MLIRDKNTKRIIDSTYGLWIRKVNIGQNVSKQLGLEFGTAILFLWDIITRFSCIIIHEAKSSMNSRKYLFCDR